jgi:predicted GNAT family N-acyltransferase
MQPTDRIEVLAAPATASAKAVDAFVTLVSSASEVAKRGLSDRVAQARTLIMLYRHDGLIGTAAIKIPNGGYRKYVFTKAQVTLPKDNPLELGWIAVDEAHRGQRLARVLVAKAMETLGGAPVYATTRTDNLAMLRILPNYGFAPVGRPYASQEHPGQKLALLVSWRARR